MPTLGQLVAAHIERWHSPGVELGVFGMAEAEVIAGHLEAFVETALGSPVGDSLFYGSSSGCVAGLVLADGRRVVVKAYQRRWGAEFLGAVRRVQEHLAEAHFPCPRPLVGPQPAGPALATVEELVADPGMRALATPAEMARSAEGLARQIGLCREQSEPALEERHPLRAEPDRLYPQPHNPIFDLTLDAGAARWIDDLAAAAKAARRRDGSAPVEAHTDWSARNVRYDEAGVVVAYDWDSLSMVPEAVAVGQAAATWRSTGEATDPMAPGPGEVDAYLDLYGAASRRPLTTEQRAAARGAALWVLAYTARCEHALEAVTGRRVERARSRLRLEGHAYLT